MERLLGWLTWYGFVFWIENFCFNYFPANSMIYYNCIIDRTFTASMLMVLFLMLLCFLQLLHFLIVSSYHLAAIYCQASVFVFMKQVYLFKRNYLWLMWMFLNYLLFYHILWVEEFGSSHACDCMIITCKIGLLAFCYELRLMT